jgi:LuxR family maltose regulon positive regulatory protein
LNCRSSRLDRGQNYNKSMFVPILATKLYIPSPRPKVVPHPRPIERLNEGLSSGSTPGVTLISAFAGFGKTTLISEWVVGVVQQRAPMVSAAWLSLDEGDRDPTRFLMYLISWIFGFCRVVCGARSAPQTTRPS